MKIYRWNVYSAILLLGVFFLFSCSKKDNELEWEWDDDEEEVPGEEKPRYIWVDASANFPDFANSRENIRRDLTKAKEAGFTDIVVDVRPSRGDVLFQTDVADPARSLHAWVSGTYTEVPRTANWDYLQAFIEEGHELDLKIHAGINTFTGGNRSSLGNFGMLYTDESKRNWATHLLTHDGVRNTLDDPATGAKFFNPVHHEVQGFLLDLLDDLAAYQDLDGIILDRGRFDALDSDFSEYTREKFEEYLGFAIPDFPENVMTPELATGEVSFSSLSQDEIPEYFHKWLEFRVKVIHDFMEDARYRVKAANPDMSFGVYVGAWYSTYFSVGVNWASPDYDPSRFYAWASDKYKDYGYADNMDVILIGAYASPTSIYGSSEWTVEGFCSNAVDKIRGDALVVGGPDVGNGAWATTSESVVNQAITQSVDAAMKACDGYFLFDMIHLKNKNQWQYVQQGIEAAIGKD